MVFIFAALKETVAEPTLQKHVQQANENIKAIKGGKLLPSKIVFVTLLFVVEYLKPYVYYVNKESQREGRDNLVEHYLNFCLQ